MAKEDFIKVPRDEFETLVQDNQENQKTIQNLSETVERLQSAVLAGVGKDPEAAARAHVGTVLVQFTRHYHRAAQPSRIQDGTNIFDAYSVDALGIVHLKKDEADRLDRDFPGLIIRDRKKFKDVFRHRVVPEFNEAGRMIRSVKSEKLNTDELVKVAPVTG